MKRPAGTTFESNPLVVFLSPRSSADTITRSQGAHNTLVERQSTKLRVVGSNPSGGTTSVQIQESTLNGPESGANRLRGLVSGLRQRQGFYVRCYFGSGCPKKARPK